MPLHRKLPKLDLNITNRCNFRCVHCAFDSGIEHMSELSVKEIKKILTDTKELGGERIDLTGGEPTVREDLADI
ncbi:MAG: radical SAM protein, partial [Nanoarchaeota archaeon]|nr:radical SAM protein [Nanoarchaeota archaeon]